MDSSSSWWGLKGSENLQVGGGKQIIGGYPRTITFMNFPGSQPVKNSLKCHTSPPPDPWGAWVRGGRRVTSFRQQLKSDTCIRSCRCKKTWEFQSQTSVRSDRGPNPPDSPPGSAAEVFACIETFNSSQKSHYRETDRTKDHILYWKTCYYQDINFVWQKEKKNSSRLPVTRTSR